MYYHDDLVNQRSKVFFYPICVFILSYIIVHSGENQDNFFSKIMYISHFQFFLSDGILYYLLAISSLVCPYAKQNAKQQGKVKLLLVKNSWNGLENIKSLESSQRILNLRTGKLDRTFLFPNVRASVMTIWGYFTSAI